MGYGSIARGFDYERGSVVVCSPWTTHRVVWHRFFGHQVDRLMASIRDPVIVISERRSTDAMQEVEYVIGRR